MTKAELIKGFEELNREHESDIIRCIERLAEHDNEPDRTFRLCEWIATLFDDIADNLEIIERIKAE